MAEVIFVDEQRPPIWLILPVLVLTGYSVWVGVREEVWFASVVSAAVLVLILLSRVRVEVRRNAVLASWRPLRKRHIPWNEIVSAEPVHYNPLRDYGGWGIRYGKKGWAYTLKGNQGVLLTLRSAKPLLLGSDHPDELAAAINGILAPTSPTERAER